MKTSVGNGIRTHKKQNLSDCLLQNQFLRPLTNPLLSHFASILTKFERRLWSKKLTYFSIEGVKRSVLNRAKTFFKVCINFFFLREWSRFKMKVPAVA